MATINLAAHFLLELIAVAAVGYWGFQAVPDSPARILVAVAAPTALIMFWGLVVAPKANNDIPLGARFLIGAGTMLIAAVALAVAGEAVLAATFATAVAVNTVLLFVLGHDIPQLTTRSA